MVGSAARNLPENPVYYRMGAGLPTPAISGWRWPSVRIAAGLTGIAGVECPCSARCQSRGVAGEDGSGCRDCDAAISGVAGIVGTRCRGLAAAVPSVHSHGNRRDSGQGVKRMPLG
jgi:hypothetical protein